MITRLSFNSETGVIEQAPDGEFVSYEDHQAVLKTAVGAAVLAVTGNKCLHARYVNDISPIPRHDPPAVWMLLDGMTHQEILHKASLVMAIKQWIEKNPDTAKELGLRLDENP